MQSLLRDVAFTSVQTIDFWPNGSAHTVGATDADRRARA